jgi:hypothetical protein
LKSALPYPLDYGALDDPKTCLLGADATLAILIFNLKTQQTKLIYVRGNDVVSIEECDTFSREGCILFWWAGNKTVSVSYGNEVGLIGPLWGLVT